MTPRATTGPQAPAAGPSVAGPSLPRPSTASASASASNSSRAGTSPISSSAAPDVEARVLTELSDRYAALDSARRAAVGSGSILSIVNAVRSEREERLLVAEDIPRVHTLEKHLVQIAADPFAPLPQGYAKFLKTVHRDRVDEKIEGSDSGGVFQLYERRVRFSSFADLKGKLEAAIAAYPALVPRLTPTLLEVSKRLGQNGPAFLYYTGCSVASSPETRAADDDKVTRGRMLVNLLSLWDVVEVEVFEVELPGIDIDRFEYRSRFDLQREEHCLISARYPHCLNSAPGGFAHDYRADRYTPRPWPALGSHRAEPEAVMKNKVERHFRGFAKWFKGRTGEDMATTSLVGIIEVGSPRFVIQGRSPVVMIGKDITAEEFRGANEDLGYRQPLAGPGPQATRTALLHQHGVDARTETDAGRLDLLPPFCDLYLEPRHWWEVGLIFLLRFLALHGWPVIVWVESAEVTWAFEQNALARIDFEGDAERFFDADAHDPTGSCEVAKGTVLMSKYAGVAFISSVAGRESIVLANYDRGVLKYDPELAQDRWTLQLAADAAHQARVSAYLQHILVHGYPADRASVQRLYDAGEAAVPASVCADLDVWRKRVGERENVIQSLRMRSAAARGSRIGNPFRSEDVVKIRTATYAKNVKAAGDKTRRGRDDPARLAQFEELLAEQRERDARHLPDSRHPCRPSDMTTEQWREWFLRLDTGIEIVTSAAVHGKTQQSAVGKAHTQEVLAA